MASQPPEPVYGTPVPFFTRLVYVGQLYLTKFAIKVVFRIINLPGIRNKAHQPTFTKVYPIQPSLRHRIFVPKQWKHGDAPLPLYLDIHGGGFVMLEPWVDDAFCANFCNENKLVVVSLDYPLAPASRYPKAVHALVDVVKAVLGDESLPIDTKKVTIGGFSAGANLSLACTQDPSLQGKIGGLVAYYPPCDISTPVKVAMATRPANAGKDILESSADSFNWAYCTDDINLRDPQVSPKYAERAKLPPKLYIVGCDFDLLCRDSEIMAEKFASVGNGKRTGTDDCWERNGVKWERILGEQHAFDFVLGSGEIMARRMKRRAEMYASVAEFLFREVYI